MIYGIDHLKVQAQKKANILRTKIKSYQRYDNFHFLTDCFVHVFIRMKRQTYFSDVLI